MALREVLAYFGFKFDHTEANKAEKKVHGLEEQFGHFKHALEGAAFTFVGKKTIETLVEWAKHVAESRNQLVNMSERLGMSAQQLQVWQYAAHMADVSVDELYTSLGQLGRTLPDAARGEGELGKLFQQMGVSAKDGHGGVKQLGDILPEIFENFQKIPEGPLRSEAAFKIFGRAGKAMLPFLNEGTEGLKKMTSEFGELGIVITKEAIEAAKKYEESSKKLDLVITSLKTKLVEWLIPALTWLNEKLTKVSRKFLEWNKETHFLETTGKILMAMGVGGLLAGLTKLLPLLGRLMFMVFRVALPWALLYLLVDDFWGLFTGKDSLVGGILDGLFGEDASKKFVKFWQDVGNEAKGFFNDLFTNTGKWKDDMGILLKGIFTGDVFRFIKESWGPFGTELGVALWTAVFWPFHRMEWFKKIIKEVREGPSANNALEGQREAAKPFVKAPESTMSEDPYNAFPNQLESDINGSRQVALPPSAFRGAGQGSGGASGGVSQQVNFGSTEINLNLPSGSTKNTADAAARALAEEQERQRRQALKALESQSSQGFGNMSGAGGASGR